MTMAATTGPTPNSSVSVVREAATATEQASLGSFLLDFPLANSRTRAASLGRHVHDVLPGGNELLGQQVTQAARPFHRPRPLPERRRPVEQPLDLARAGPDLHLAERPLTIVDGHRGVRPLVRIDTDHHRHEALPDRLMEDRGGHV